MKRRTISSTWSHSFEDKSRSTFKSARSLQRVCVIVDLKYVLILLREQKLLSAVELLQIVLLF